MNKTLVSWIGQTDLDAAGGKESAGIGPVAGALTGRAFDRATLLCNYPKQKWSGYLPWLKAQCKSPTRIEAHQVTLSDPTDHTEVYRAVDSQLKRLVKGGEDGLDLTFHLSPGTPTMAVVWILLASMRYPARLIQTSREKGVVDASLPFDIAAEFVPDLVRRSKLIQDLVAAEPEEAPEFSEIIHRSSVMKVLIARARQAALSDVPILIEGESGTGKELFARAIHRASPRHDGPLRAVNCGAIPKDLIESELFGHERGAFTGADRPKAGVFEAADRGTLFLDELGELPPAAQVRLLRVAEDGKVIPVGSHKEKSVDVRIVAATNRNLIEEVRAGRFRQDLYYRLAVATIKLPPLRDREGDITPLVDLHLNRINEAQKKVDRSWESRRLSPGAKRALLRHPWPGNVRELVNTLRRAVIWSTELTLAQNDIDDALLPTLREGGDGVLNRPLGEGLDLRQLTAEVERHYVERALKEAGGNKSKAAKLIGLPSYQTLTNWMARLGIEAEGV